MGTTTFVWDPVFDCLTHELDENNAVKAVYHNEPQQYGGVLSQRRGNTSHYHHHDALGSTRFLTDSTGNVTDTYLNDAWGTSVASTGTTVNPFKWIGKYGYYTDNSTGQVYVRERTYQPMVARWRSVDPVWALQDDTRSQLYTTNRPVNAQDPSGLWANYFGSKHYYQAVSGDTFEELVWIANPAINPTLNKACIQPIFDVDAEDWWQQKVTPCGIYSIENLIPRKSWAPNELKLSVGEDPEGNQYIKRATAFFGATNFPLGSAALNSIGSQSRTGLNPITKLIVIGHSWNSNKHIGGTNQGGQLTFPLIHAYHEANRVFQSIDGYFYWQQSLSRAMEGKFTVPCWLAVDADVYFVGCESSAFTIQFARHILRTGAVGHGTSHPTWAVSKDEMGWGKAVRNGNVNQDRVVFDGSEAAKPTSDRKAYLGHQWFGNSDGKN